MTRNRRSAAALVVGLVIAVLPGMAWPAEPPAKAAPPAWAFAEFELDDGAAAFAAWKGDILAYREGDLIVSTRSKGPGRFVSTSGHEVTLVDGGIRVVAPPGQVRNGRKVEPYRSEEVRFRSEEVELAGSVFVPPGPGPHPGVVLVSGSGAVDRGGLLGYASLFARHGIAALAYDKRGAGGSSGRYRLMADHRALAGDLLAGVQHLRARPDVDPGRVGVWGVSEGGLVAPLAASRSSDVAFVVAVSPPGVAPIRAFLWQSQQRLLHEGVGRGPVGADARAVTVLYRGARALGIAGTGPDEWDLDPALVFENVRQPTLVVYGEHDRLVPPARGATVIGEALRRGANWQATLRTFSGADHGIFVHEDGFRKAQDYERGTLQLAPGFTTTMVDWVSARGRGEPAERRDDRPLRPPERVWEVDARPWHESPAVHLAGGSLLAATFTGTVAARLGVWLLRRARRRRPPELSASIRRARSLALAVAVGGSVLMIGLVLRLAAFIRGAPLPAARAALLAAGMATTALAVALVVCTVRAWSEPWPGRARLAHGALAAAAVVLVPFAGYWRLLG